MATLNIVATGPGAGKTSLAGALARTLMAGGRKVAYYKPLSAQPEADPDVEFMGRLLASPGVSHTALLPFDQPIDPEQLPTRLSEARNNEVTEAVAGLEANFDDVLVEWDAPAVTPGRPVILIHSLAGGQDVEAAAGRIAEESARYGDDLTGVIVNNAPRHRRREVEDKLVGALKGRGLPMLGALPEDREMLALTLGQVAEFLEGNWVEEPADSELWVDRFLIGGNIMDSGPNYFGRYSNQAVIARAGRPDIQMASLACDTKLLVLTGGEEPTEYIRVEAQKREASLLLVAGDTLETAESLGELLARANPYGEHKPARFGELLRRHLDGIPGVDLNVD